MFDHYPERSARDVVVGRTLGAEAYVHTLQVGFLSCTDIFLPWGNPTFILFKFRKFYFTTDYADFTDFGCAL